MPEDDWGGNGGWHMTIQNGSPAAYERCPDYWRAAGFEVYTLNRGDVERLKLDYAWIGARVGLRLSGSVERVI